MQRSSINAISVDASSLGDADLDGLGEFLDSGRVVVLGLLPTSAPQRRPSADEVAAAAVAITDRIGFSHAAVGQRVGISPACGLAGATAQWARAALELAQKAAEAVDGDPAAI